MKKIFSLIAIVLGAASLFSCSDPTEPMEGGCESTGRMFMTMFRTDNNTGKGDQEQYRCQVVNRNNFDMRWYAVKGAYGYQVRMALQPRVSSGNPEAWDQYSLIDTVLVGENVTSLLVKDQEYLKNFYFAIRTLHSADLNDPLNSNWYGYGSLRQWSEYVSMPSEKRYATPNVILEATGEDENGKPQKGETYLTIKLQPNISNFKADLQKEYRQNSNLNAEAESPIFEIDGKGDFQFQTLECSPSPSNPDAKVGAGWDNYTLTPEDFQRGYVKITGLEPNATYVINVKNNNPTKDGKQLAKWDAYFNTITTRTDGTPGDPILLKHADLLAECDTFPDAVKVYNAARITPSLKEFISSTKYAEGQEFWLEGGKTYYLDGNDETSKGFILRTNPEDVAKGLRATVLCGLGQNELVWSTFKQNKQVNASFSNFIFGRSPLDGESGEISMKMLEFYDIDWDCPTANTYGDVTAKVPDIAATGNYFINMYSDGMPVKLGRFVIKNCSFQHMVRGFVREQGPNYKIFEQMIIEDNLFFNNGYYSNGAGGYVMFVGANNNAETNIFKDFIFRNNTMFDNPLNGLISEGKNALSWNGLVKYKFTIENNTFVNFCTRGAGYMFSLRNIPDGTEFHVSNNLFVQTKQSGDVRDMVLAGSDIRSIIDETGANSGKATFDVHDNYSTGESSVYNSSYLTNGQIFSTYAFEAEKNSMGAFYKSGQGIYPAGVEGLKVIVDDISPEELMISPNPPCKAAAKDDRYMHRADGITGSVLMNYIKENTYVANLFYQNSEKVRNSQIYQKKIGASIWREGIGGAAAKRRTR